MAEAGTRDPQPRDPRDPPVTHRFTGGDANTRQPDDRTPRPRRRESSGPSGGAVRIVAFVLALPVLASFYLVPIARRLRVPQLRLPPTPRRIALSVPSLASAVSFSLASRGPRAPFALAALGQRPRFSLETLSSAGAARPALVVVAGALLTIGSIGSAAEPLRSAPAPDPAATPEPLAIARVGPAVLTGYGLVERLRFEFSNPMDSASVETALQVEPTADIRLAWDNGAQRLDVVPTRSWRPATRYTLTIGSAAKDVYGRTLASPVAARFTTRPPVRAALRITRLVAGRAPIDATLELRFSRPVLVSSVAKALKITPATAGKVFAAGAVRAGLSTRVAWRPSAALKRGTAYAFALRGAVVDEDGLSASSRARVVVRTIAPPPTRPAVVRHRPASGATGVPRDALISIRFTERMDRRSTQRAFAMTGLDASRDGSFDWVENDTVIVFDPTRRLKAGGRYKVSLAGTARSARGVPLKVSAGTPLSYTFRVAAPTSSTTSAARSSGGSSRTGWTAVERYVLGLVNCMRTGGYLRSNGSCSGYGSGKNGGYARPLKINAAISTKVSRPYAKFLAVRNLCNHFLDGNPGYRLRRAGYTSYRWGENLGCRWGNPYTSVLGSHLYFQSERPYNGGHWVNLKNPKYTTVGIGVWVSHGNVRVVTDFYDPL